MRRSLPTVERSPDRPGPGPVPPAVLRSLDLAVLRRVESLVPGEHLTPQVGAGTELAMIRPYFPGDDVRHIDWNVTARMREPHVRVHVGERALTTWLVLDTSASMTFGTAERRKFDVAEGVALAVGHVASRRGNRLGVVSFGGGTPKVMRPRQGRLGLLQLLAELRGEPEGEGAGATSLGAAVFEMAVPSDVAPAPSGSGSARSSASRPSRPSRPWRGRRIRGSPPPSATTPKRLPRRVQTWPMASATPSATSVLRRSAVPNVIDADTSSSSQAVIARSPTWTRTCVSCMRAVTFQSMWRTSSPGR